MLRSRFRRQHSVDRGLSSTSSSQSSLASLASLPRPPDCSALLNPAAATGTNELPLFSQAASADGFCLQLPPTGRRSAAANISARQPSAVLRSVSFGQGERLAAAASGREEEYRGGGGGLGSFTSVPLFGPFPVGWEPSLLRERPRTTTQRRLPEESTRVQPEVKQRQQDVTSCRSLSISSAGTYTYLPSLDNSEFVAKKCEKFLIIFPY
jgi:hypothetical protein